MSAGYALGVISVVIVVFAIVVALQGFFMMILWNFLVPTLFALPSLTYWQACVLPFLLNLVGGALRPRIDLSKKES